jgi:hypothetical protein
MVKTFRVRISRRPWPWSVSRVVSGTARPGGQVWLVAVAGQDSGDAAVGAVGDVLVPAVQRVDGDDRVA